MKVLSPIPLWYRLTETARVALKSYQMDNYGLNLDIPPYPPDFLIAPIILDTEQAARLMTRRPRGRGGRP